MQISPLTTKTNSNYIVANIAKQTRVLDKTVAFNAKDKNTNKNGDQNKTFWKYMAYLVVAAALITGGIIEIKGNRKYKLDMDEAQRAKEELEKINQQLREQLDQSLKEIKEWQNKLNQSLLKQEKKNNIKEEVENIVTKTTEQIGEKQVPIPQALSETKIITRDDILELKRLQEEVNRVQEELLADQGLLQKIEIMKEVSGVNRGKGFGKIVGYEAEKSLLREKLLKPIEQNDVENIPNLIILYGPKGTGKTQFSLSVADEASCNIAEFITSLDESTDIELLKELAEKAKEDFAKNGKRTFIFMDEAESFLSTESKEAKQIIENLARDYNSTIIATTNYPQSINRDIMQAEKVEKIYLSPITFEELPMIIEYYTHQFSKEPLNYEEIAKIIINNSGDDRYSNAHIIQIIQSKIHNVMDLPKKSSIINLLQQKDLVEAFENSSPDIKSEILNNYKNIL